MRARFSAFLLVLVLLPTVTDAQPASPTPRFVISDEALFTVRDMPSTAPATRYIRPVLVRRRPDPKGMVVAGLVVLGLFGGMLITSRVALPCHCDDPETVVVRGGLVGAAAGAIAGIVLTSR